MLGLYIKDNSKLPVTNNIPFGVEIFYVNIDKIHIANLCNENEKKKAIVEYPVFILLVPKLWFFD